MHDFCPILLQYSKLKGGSDSTDTQHASAHYVWMLVMAIYPSGADLGIKAMFLS